MKNLTGVVSLAMLILGLAALVWIAQNAWYQKTKPQQIKIQDINSPAEMQTVSSTVASASIPTSTSNLSLEGKTQTVEIFVFQVPLPDELSYECSAAVPLKRTIPWTGGGELDHYQAAMQELMKGLTPQEIEAGYITAIPLRAELLSVIKAENGRYTADFADTISIIQSPCLKRAIKTQVQKTLSHVPLQGRTLLGSMTINNQPINW